MFKIQKDRSSRTKVITQKPFSLQMYNDDSAMTTNLFLQSYKKSNFKPYRYVHLYMEIFTGFYCLVYIHVPSLNHKSSE